MNDESHEPQPDAAVPEPDLGRGPVAGDYAVTDPTGPSGRSGGGRRRKVAIAVVGVVAVLTTGLAITQLTAADGAESPEAAVQAFFDAVDQEDALGVLESLAPAERDVLVPSVQALADQLTDLEVAGDDLDLEKVGGLDLETTGLALRTQGLHPDVAAVEITGGTLATSAMFGDLPMGKVLDAAMERTGRGPDEQVKGSEALDLTLVVVKGDEGWHVSLLYSLAEAERASDGGPVPDFGNGIPAKGADSPRAAVDAMVAAFNDEDYDRMVELTPPDTMAVLHDYGPDLLVDDADPDDDSFARLEDVKLGEPEGSGGTRRLAVQGYRLVDTYDGEKSTITYDGSCITMDLALYAAGDGEPEEQERTCADDPRGDVDDSTGFAIGPTPFGPLLGAPGAADIVVVERDGAWYVDPSRSIIDSTLANLEEMPADQVDRMVEYWAAFFGGDEEAFYALVGPEFYEQCPGIEAPSEDATFDERVDAARRCEEEWLNSDPGEEGGFVDLGDAEEDCAGLSGDAAEACLDELAEAEEALPEEACYDSDDQAEVEACITALGDPDALQDFREVACYDAEEDAAIEACLQGLGDPSALGEFHADSCYDTDDDAAIEACLQGLVDKGELGPEVVVELRCSRVYDDVEEGDMSAADDAYDRCLVDASAAAGVPPPTTG